MTLLSSLQCRCCLAQASDFGSAVMLGHVSVRYYRCQRCGFIQTEDPTWLEEAYSSPIAHLDVGLLNRCIHLANRTEAVVRMLPRGGRYLDWAGGYGVLTRLLRDRGLDFRHNDAYTPNLFAAGWEGDLEESWDLITMYEALEHLVDPFVELSLLANAAPILLFSTQLLPTPAPAPDSWWYYALETGQHVSFFSRQALQALADRLQMKLVTDGSALHALHRPRGLPRAAAALVRWSIAARAFRPVLRRSRPTASLIAHDFRAAHRALPGADLPN